MKNNNNPNYNLELIIINSFYNKQELYSVIYYFI